MRKILFYCGILIFTGLAPMSSAKELVIATTFSPESMGYIIKQWQKDNSGKEIRLINRTASSLTSLLSQPNMEHVDLVLSSSPFLFHKLQQKHYLLPLPDSLSKPNRWVPDILAKTTTAIAFSGYGIFYNKHLLNDRHLPIPTDWESLFDPNYVNGVLISSPSRSGTNHIMLEMLLQQRGWDRGWQDFLTIASNISLISSRSFNVVDKVKQGLAAAGISIDTYATNQLQAQDHNVGFVYFPNSVASPTFIAIHHSSKNQKEAVHFIQYLLDKPGQEAVATRDFAKYPLFILNQDNPLYFSQQQLLSKPALDYEILLARQHLVEKLFDAAITFRLSQLKETWAELYRKENETHKKLTALREMLTKIPVSATQAMDQQFLLRLNNDKAFSLEQEKQWALFFQNQINLVLKALSEE